MELIRITPDKQRAKNILNMIALLEKRILLQDTKTMSSLILADYYEIIKELITGILFVDGYKTLSHKYLFEYLSANYKDFSSNELSLLDDLRILRNRIAYEGFNAPSIYLERNKESFKGVIKKLKSVLENKVK